MHLLLYLHWNLNIFILWLLYIPCIVEVGSDITSIGEVKDCVRITFSGSDDGWIEMLLNVDFSNLSKLTGDEVAL